jgi:hypothetical protein
LRSDLPTITASAEPAAYFPKTRFFFTFPRNLSNQSNVSMCESDVGLRFAPRLRRHYIQGRLMPSDVAAAVTEGKSMRRQLVLANVLANASRLAAMLTLALVAVLSAIGAESLNDCFTCIDTDTYRCRLNLQED